MKKKTVINMGGVNSQGTGGALPEGEYALIVDKVELKTSDNSGKDYLSFTFKVSDGHYEGRSVFHNCSLQPQALFNLRGLLEALEVDIPSGNWEIEPDEWVDLECGATLGHREYEGKTRNEVLGFFALDVPQPAPKPAPEKKGKKPAPKPAPSFAIGSSVSFIDDEGDIMAGVVTHADTDGVYTVTVDEGEEWELSANELTAI